LRVLILSALLLAAVDTYAQQDNPLVHIREDWGGASWIWRGGDNAEMWVAFRKTVTLDAAPGQAVASIAVESKYWLWVNGEPVVREGGLKRGPTPVDGYYDEVDLAPYLRTGDNVIAILVWNWDKSGYSHASSGSGGLLFHAAIDGLTIVSDPSWKVLRMLAFGYSDVPVPNFALPERNVIFDARKDVGGWYRPDYSVRQWPDAIAIGEASGPPWNRLFRRPVPQWRWSDLLTYRDAGPFPFTSTGDTIVVSLPDHAHVTPFLRIRATEGDTVEIRTDRYNVPSPDRVRKHNTIRAEYVTVDGEQEFETFGWMNGEAVRYHIPAGIEVLDLRYRESGYDTDFVGTFSVDDPMLNTLWVKARETVYGTMRDYYMETAGRERKQATSDGARALLSAAYSMDDRTHALARKFWSEFSDWRTAEGAFRSGVPGNWLPEQPQINLYAYGEYGFWHYYLLTGDREVLDTIYPHIRKYLFLWNMGPSGLVEHRFGDWDWFDWEHNIDEPAIENALYQISLRAAIKMAVETGNEQDVPEWERRMESIHKAYNDQFWRGTYYMSPDHNGPPDDRANALAVLAGLADRRHWDNLKAVLREERHASPYMDHFVVKAMFEMEDLEGALTRLKERYGDMVEHPSSTLREYWDADIGSLEHPFATGTLKLLTNYIAGIEPTAAGFSRVRVEPNPATLTRIEANVPSPKGFVELDLTQRREIDEGESALSMSLSVPQGVLALVGIPKPPGELARIETGGTVIWFEDQPLDRVEGVEPVVETNHHVRFEVSSGDWTFEVYIKPPPARFTGTDTRLEEEDTAVLVWETEEERDSTTFVIEELINGEYVPVGFSDGSGSGGDAYRYSIAQPGPGIHRYRIKAVGAEGGVSYSAEMVLEIPMERTIDISEFYPNPTSRMAVFSAAVREGQVVTGDIVNSLGQTVRRVFEAFLDSGARYRYYVDASDLAPGSYGVVLRGQGVAVRRFVVAR
jgi:hypothetical protein